MQRLQDIRDHCYVVMVVVRMYVFKKKKKKKKKNKYKVIQSVEAS